MPTTLTRPAADLTDWADTVETVLTDAYRPGRPARWTAKDVARRARLSVDQARAALTELAEQGIVSVSGNAYALTD